MAHRQVCCEEDSCPELLDWMEQNTDVIEILDLPDTYHTEVPEEIDTLIRRDVERTFPYLDLDRDGVVSCL